VIFCGYGYHCPKCGHIFRVAAVLKWVRCPDDRCAQQKAFECHPYRLVTNENTSAWAQPKYFQSFASVLVAEAICPGRPPTAKMDDHKRILDAHDALRTNDDLRSLIEGAALQVDSMLREKKPGDEMQLDVSMPMREAVLGILEEHGL
jgi:hypothetical protein